ncbi:hypothetical protein LJR125_003734 [Pseudoxanthomonas sp. LjRoot125]
MAQFDPPCIAFHQPAQALQARRAVLVDAVGVDFAARARGFGHQPGVGAQLVADVRAAHLERRERVAVVHVGAANLAARADAQLRIRTEHQELLGALVQFVGDAQRHRVEVAVERGQEAVEQDAPGERLEAVVDQPAERTHRDDARGLVAVAHDHFHALAAFQHRVVAKAVRTAACGRQLFDHLAQRVFDGEHVAAHARILEVPTQAGRGAVVGTQHALAGAGAEIHAGLRGDVVAGLEIAVQQVATVLVHAHVQALGRPRVEAAQRCIAIHRIELLRLDVAQQARAHFLVRVVGGGQQVLALDRALDEERSTRRAVGLAAVELLLPAADLALEPVALLRAVDQAVALAAEVDDAFDQARCDQLAHLRHETDDALGAVAARGHSQQHVLRIMRRQQLELGAPVAHRQLDAGRDFIGVQPARAELVRATVGQLDAAAAVLDGGEGLARHRLAVGAIQLHHHLDRRLTVGRHAVAVDLDHHAVHADVDAVVDVAGLRVQRLRCAVLRFGRLRVQRRGLAQHRGEPRVAGDGLRLHERRRHRQGQGQREGMERGTRSTHGTGFHEDRRTRGEAAHGCTSPLRAPSVVVGPLVGLGSTIGR